MKKIISLILALTLATFAFASCSGYYEPVASTDKEKTTVLKLTFGEEIYEIKYEFYRALFLTLKNDVDLGD